MDKRAPLSEERRRLLALRLKGSAKAPAEARRIPRRPAGQRTPLSAGQHQMWVVDQLAPGNPAYNIPIAYRIRGTLDVRALEEGINQIIRRHEAWRTTFCETDGDPVQEIHPECRIRMGVTDLSHLPAEECEAKYSILAAEEGARPFDLHRLPLIRVTLFKLGGDGHVLLINVHHIICDVWSCAIFARELTALYAAIRAGQPNPLPELELQFGDYAQWQRGQCTDEAMASHLAFWRERLSGDRAPLPVPADRPRPAVQSHRGGLRARDLFRELAAKLRDLARAEGVTLFILTLAAFKALLARFSGETDICLGSPIAQRPNEETEKLIGYFLNMLALQSDLSGDPTFREVLRRVRSTVLDAFQHQDVPFEKIVEDLHPNRDPSHQPVFQIAFVLLPPSGTLPEFAGAQVKPETAPVTTAKFDLTLFIEETGEGMRATMEYSSDQFDPATADRMLESLELLLDGIVSAPDATLSHLPILGVGERQRILTEWSGSERPYPQDQTIAARFAECAALTPGAIAVIEGCVRLTYAELDARANRVAHALRSRGIRAGDFIGLRADRSLAFVVKLLGIVKAGAAYVPLDEHEPVPRLDAMRQACAMILDEEPAADLPDDPAVSGARPDDAAYVLFTSGSTGMPKGVIVPHRAIMRLIVNNEYAPLQADDVVAFASNVCFDAATFEIWGALLNGATLVVTPHEVLLSTTGLAPFLTGQGITTLFVTTALFNQIARQDPATFRSLRHLLFGGEICNPDRVRDVLLHGAPQRLIHVYGPTEATTFSSWHLITEVPAGAVTIPIGRPISNTTIHILDSCLQPVPCGVIGEVFIGGPGLAIGYLHDPKLTAERFIETQFGRLYRTGDLARRRADGAIEFCGRKDLQVKLRGFRIELGEIETALQQHPLIRHAAVVARTEEGASHSLIGYLVPQSGTHVEIADLRQFLSQRLPAYMIPTAFTWLAALPLTANGKLDAKRLPLPDTATVATSAAPVLPRNEIERGIAGIWQRVMGRGAASIHDDFFTVGGHSLLALRLLGEIRNEFGIEIPARRLFENPTIAGLGEFVCAQKVSVSGSENLLVSVQKGTPSTQPLFLVPGGWGGEIEFLVYAELSRQIDPALPIWGLKARGAGTGEPPHESVSEMAADYLRAVRRIQPHGPYRIAGECVGGICAYEMACQLENAGEKVALLVLLDTVVPADRHLENYVNAESRKQDAESRPLSVSQRIRHHLDQMAGLSLGGKIGYIFNKAARRGKAGPARHETLPQQHPRGQKDYPVTLLRHQLKRYAGTVTLLLDEESSHLYGQLGWDKAPVSRIESQILPGDHLTYIRENAATAAAKLRELLQPAPSISHHDPAIV